jgi:O-antigen ligase
MDIVKHSPMRRRRSVPQLLLAWVLLFPLLFLAVHGRPSFRETGISVDDEINLNAHLEGAAPEEKGFLHYSIYMAYAVMLCVCLKEWRKVWREMWLCPPVILLAMLAMASAVWSQVPLESVRSGFYYLLDTLFAVYLVVTFTTEELMTLTMMLGTAVAMGSLLVVAVFPEYGLVHQVTHTGVWRGIFAEKNDAAKNLAFLLTPVCNRRILRPLSMAYGGLILGLIVMTRSATAIVIVAAYIVFMLGLQLYKRMKASHSTFLVLLAGLLVAVVAAVGYIEFGEISALLGRDPTLTGRTDIWTVLLESARKRPMLGYGFSAFWTGMEGESGKLYMQMQWFFTYAHSGLLEIVLQLGLVGLAVVLFTLGQAMRNAMQVARRSASVSADWFAGLIFLTMAYNLDEGTMLFTHTLPSLFFVLACVGLAKKARDRAQRAAVRTMVRPVVMEASVRVA